MGYLLDMKDENKYLNGWINSRKGVSNLESKETLTRIV